MSTIKLTILGHSIKVEYDYLRGDKGGRYTPPTEDSVDIIGWDFEDDDAIEDIGLTDEDAISDFEDELCQNIKEHERAKRVKERWIKPYLTAKKRRISDSL